MVNVYDLHEHSHKTYRARLDTMSALDTSSDLNATAWQGSVLFSHANARLLSLPMPQCPCPVLGTLPLIASRARPLSRRWSQEVVNGEPNFEVCGLFVPVGKLLEIMFGGRTLISFPRRPSGSEHREQAQIW